MLTPRRPSPYVSIVLYVSAAANSRGVIRRMAIETHGGDWNRFDFADAHYGEGVSLPSFEVSVPDGATEISRP